MGFLIKAKDMVVEYSGRPSPERCTEFLPMSRHVTWIGMA
ncbi:hypothetical protein SAMN04488688_101991 [Paenibacillus sp. cl141a]|nr:hypothetical protein SAMN04488688_101991 [Paenibacillus sp. cl141a]